MPPDPRANPLLLGHEAAEATLLEALRSGRMHHAWLITGPDGIGKATLAYRFARRLLGGMPRTTASRWSRRTRLPALRRRRARRLLTVELAFDEKRSGCEPRSSVDTSASTANS